MNLRQKMVITLGIITVVGISSMWVFTENTLKEGFEGIELEVMKNTVLWGVDDLYDYGLVMDSSTAPIAAWDDMYNYMAKGNQSFIDEIFSDNVLKRNEFNLVAIYSNTGDVLYGKFYDYNTDTLLNFPTIFNQKSTYEALSNFDPDTNSVVGIMNYQNHLLVIASRPILNTAETAPSRGILVLGLIFSDKEIESIHEITGLPLNYRTSESQAIPQDIRSELTTENPFTYRLSLDTITGYYAVADIFGNPAAIISISQPREVYQAAQEIRRGFLSIIIGIGFLLGTIAIVYADRTIFRRVIRLSDEISEITKVDDLSARVHTTRGDDEINLLTTKVNEMLQRLEESRAIEKQQQETVDQLREDSAKEIFEAAKKISYLVNNELERPLRSMKQVAYNLREENNKELADILESSIKYSEATLIELANLSNLGEPKRTISDLNEVVDAAISNIEPRKGVTVEAKTSDEFLAINIDALKVTRAIENIIRNAVEAIEDKGTVEIKVTNDEKTAIVIVSDDGVGIPASKLDAIYEPFHSTKSGAMGLGLLYARQAIEAHGGSISISSVEGKGTTVTVKIPLSQAP